MKKIISLALAAMLMLTGMTVTDTIAKASTNPAAVTINENPTSNSYEIPAGEDGILIPITIEKAGVVVFFTNVAGNTDNYATGTVSEAGKVLSVRSDKTTNREYQFKATGPCKIYYAITKTQADLNANFTVQLKTMFYNATNGGDLSAGQKFDAAQVNDSDYYKITLAKDGYVKVNNDFAIICSSNKKEISNPEGKKVLLKKGTYYILVKNQTIYDISYTFSAKAVAKNVTKKKAKSIKFGKKTTIEFPAAAKKGTQWFKFKINGTKKMKMSYKITAIDDYPGVEIYNAKGKSMGGAIFKALKGNALFPYIDKKGLNSAKYTKLTKGTYYLKVQQKFTESTAMTLTLK